MNKYYIRIKFTYRPQDIWGHTTRTFYIESTPEDLQGKVEAVGQTFIEENINKVNPDSSCGARFYQLCMGYWEVVSVETSQYETVLYKAALLIASLTHCSPREALLEAMRHVTYANYKDFPTTLPNTADEIDLWFQID